MTNDQRDRMTLPKFQWCRWWPLVCFVHNSRNRWVEQLQHVKLHPRTQITSNVGLTWRRRCKASTENLNTFIFFVSNSLKTWNDVCKAVFFTLPRKETYELLLQKNFYQCGCEVISSSSATGSILFGISRFVKRKLNFNLIFSVVVRPPTAPKSSVGKMTTFYLQRILMPIFFRFWGKKIAIPHNSPLERSGQKKIQL